MRRETRKINIKESNWGDVKDEGKKKVMEEVQGVGGDGSREMGEGFTCR